MHNFDCGDETAIEIDCAEECFERIADNGFALAVAVDLPAFSEQQRSVEAEFNCVAGCGFFIYKQCARDGELAFLFSRVCEVERLGDDQLQYRVAEKFEAFIILDLMR